MEHVCTKPAPPAVGRASTAAAWLLQIAVALVLGVSAAAKLTAHPESVAVFQTLGMEPGGRYLIALLELAAAALLLIPFSIPWGAILAWGVMSGALIAHLSKLGVAGSMLPMTLGAAFNWCASAAILFFRRHQIEFVRSMFACRNRNRSSRNN